MPIVELLRNASERIANARNVLNTPITACNTGNSGRYAPENAALTTFYNNFDAFDTARQGDLTKADGRVSRKDLEAAALRDDEVGAAARYILADPNLLQYLDTGSNNKDFMDKVEEGRFHATGGDGRISKEDIEAYIGKREVNRILQDVQAQIDVSAHGGNADGVLSRSDYEAFLRSGRATPEQELAIQIVLQEGVVDGEQGVANQVADIASTVGKYSGYVALGAAVVAAGMATGGVGSAALLAGVSTFGTAMGVTSTVASATEMTAGVITHDREHVVSGGLGTVTGMIGGVNSASADELLEGGAKKAVIGLGIEGGSFAANEGLSALAGTGEQNPEVSPQCELGTGNS